MNTSSKLQRADDVVCKDPVGGVGGADGKILVGIAKNPAITMSEEVRNNTSNGAAPSPDGSSQDGSVSDTPPPLTNQCRVLLSKRTKQEPRSPPPMDKRTMHEERDRDVTSPVVVNGDVGKDRDDDYGDHSPRMSSYTGRYNVDEPVTDDADGKILAGTVKSEEATMSEEINNNNSNDAAPSPDDSSQDGSVSDTPPPLTNQCRVRFGKRAKQGSRSPPPMDKRTMYEERDRVVNGEEGRDRDDDCGDHSPRMSSYTGRYHVDKNDMDTSDHLSSYFEYDSTMDRLEVECGPNKAHLFIDKLCQGSKGKCIEFNGHLLTPNEFQSISGRESAKDWKRSIRHRGKSLKTLMARGLLKAHPLLCECHSCKSVSRNLKSEKKGLPSHTTGTRHLLDDMSIDNFREYSSVRSGNIKRERSASPVDDIYDQEQRKLFEMANSPEPKSIESLQRSLAADGQQGLPVSPAEKITTSDINHNDTMSPSSQLTVQVGQYTKPIGKNRKQIAPKHLDVKDIKEKVPHIALTSFPTNFKSHQPMKPRYHQTSHSLSIPPGPSSAGESSVSAKRARSLFTPTSKSPSHVRMIELTRPAQSSSDKSGTPTSLANADDPNFRQSASSTSDTVFLPSDMSSWSVDDVAEFVRSLKGCEDYSQVFREQAIDGEILPVLTEEHLLHNMGLKLGPALKIKINVAKRLGYSFIDEM